MNLHSEKTEVLLSLCSKHGIELSAKPTRNEMLKKLSEMDEDASALLGKEPEEEVKEEPKPKQAAKPKTGFALYQEYLLREVARGSMKALEGRKADVSLPYSYDDEGYPVKFSHCAFAEKVKITKITQAQASILNSHAHTSMRYFVAVED